MPQLDPSPWLGIMLFTWLVFTTLMLPKVMSYKVPNEPLSLNFTTLDTPSATWQWH